MPLRFILKFIKLESSAGIILFFSAALAMIFCNTPLDKYYEIFKTSKPIILLINDGCMSIFFLLVGLEIKRELLEGELNSFSKAVLPAIASIGIIIATFYTSNIHYLALFCVLFFVVILLILNYLNVKRISIFCIIGFLLWICILKSGIHATIAGVILAMFIPAKNLKGTQKSPLQFLEHALHPWVAFCILPLFAFANAGVSFSSETLHHLFLPIPMGIATGLLFGKMIGIYSSTLLAVKFKISSLPKKITRLGLCGISLIAGVGFTMSLFIGGLAFGSEAGYAELVRIGVLMGSILSGLLGYFILHRVYGVSR